MIKISTARALTAVLATAAGAGGIGIAIRYGGWCTLEPQQILDAIPIGSLGGALTPSIIERIWAACPLGFLERAVAAREAPPLWIGLAVVVISVIVLGRVFCAWICPAGLVHRVLKGTRRSTSDFRANGNGSGNGNHWPAYSSYAVLGGVLLASFVFRFPVFCFFCPVGLVFGAIYAMVRVFSHDPLSIELVFFPVMLGLELWLLRSWCRSLCPMGALLSIIGNLNNIILPVINKDKCRRSEGIECGACARACPEGIDLTKSVYFTPNSCTKCLACYERCPAKAIEIHLWA